MIWILNIRSYWSQFSNRFCNCTINPLLKFIFQLPTVRGGHTPHVVMYRCQLRRFSWKIKLLLFFINEYNCYVHWRNTQHKYCIYNEGENLNAALTWQHVQNITHTTLPLILHSRKTKSSTIMSKRPQIAGIRMVHNSCNKITIV